LFGGSDRGPDLYGTESPSFYFLNLLLNFNILAPLALLTPIALVVTYFVDKRRLGAYTSSPGVVTSSPYSILAFKVMPLPLWIGILTLQPHKEERFLYPAYTLLCFNAAVTLYLARGWLERAYIGLTSSPYRASRSQIFRTFTLAVVATSAVISLARILALWSYYHAPLSALSKFEGDEVPRVLREAGLLAPEDPNMKDEDRTRLDLRPVKLLNLTMCVGAEWYRFPGHYLVPDGIRVDFVKSGFDGMLPAHFAASPQNEPWWERSGARVAHKGLNDLNEEDLSLYVPLESCDYMLSLEVSDAVSETSGSDWAPAACSPFLNAAKSRTLTRALWLPGARWQVGNEWGQWCVMGSTSRLAKKIKMGALQN
jgi:alpha-1,2-mannosyltransferase